MGVIMDESPTGCWTIHQSVVEFNNQCYLFYHQNDLSQSGGTLQIRIDKADGILLAEVKIPKGAGWNTVDTRLSKYQKGIHNLVVVLIDNNPVEVDWIRFVN